MVILGHLCYLVFGRSKELMNVSLTAELETVVNQKVQSGMYNSASEVIREGLRLLVEQDRLKQTRLEEIRHSVMLGVTDIAEGRYTDYASGEELAEEIIANGMAQRANKRKAK